MLGWFDADPSRYGWLATIATLGVLGWLIRSCFHASNFTVSRADWAWGWAIFGLLAAGRWPTWFFTRQYNEDESLLIAGANTLRGDPVFWRSVDGITSGPLNFYALMPVGSLLGRDSFLSARLTAWLLLGGALLFGHQIVVQRCGRAWGRLATLGAVLMEAFSGNTELLHCSTELVSVLLLAMGTWLATARIWQGGGTGRCLAGGIVLGSVPLAKLHCVPLALGVGILWSGWEFVRVARTTERKDPRPLLALLIGACLPTSIVAVTCVAFELGNDVLISYLLNNFHYASRSTSSMIEVAKTLALEMSRSTSLWDGWLVGIACLAMLGIVAVGAQWRSEQKYLLGSLLFLIAAAIVVLLPHRPFFHYTQLLVFPALLVSGAACAVFRLNASRTLSPVIALAAAAAITVLPILTQRLKGPILLPGTRQLQRAQQLPHSRVTLALLNFARPGDRIGVWGWLNSCYSEAGFRQATRSGTSESEIVPGPYRDYFRARYLADLKRNLPRVFIDVSVTSPLLPFPGSLRHDRIFPELAAFIRQHYTLAGVIDGDPIFVRNDPP